MKRRTPEHGPCAVMGIPRITEVPEFPGVPEISQNTWKRKKANVEEKWTGCTQCVYTGCLPRPARYFISGNYFGESLCTKCLSMREVRCGQCNTGTGMYVHLGRDPSATTMPSIICISCIMAERKKFEEQ